MKEEIITELHRLYAVEARFNNLLDELSSIIIHKQGKRPFQEIYEEVVYRYLITIEELKEPNGR